MVHGGGFYLVEKWREPEIRPQKLHWFKWEAAATWLSGALLIYLNTTREVSWLNREWTSGGLLAAGSESSF